MSFPEWGHSYNALYVPLSRWGWQCALMPAGEVKTEGSFWSSRSFEEREEQRKGRQKQIEQDREDFQRLFSVDIDRRGAAASSDFRHYADFIRDTLRASSWNMPLDGDDITHLLCRAVRDGRIVPAIDRAWLGGQRVFKHYAPQHWPRDGGGVSFAASTGGASAPTGRFTGPFAASRYAAEMVLNNRLANGNSIFGGSSSGAIASGFDWFGATKAVAGTALGGAGSDDDSRGDATLRKFGNTDGSDGGSLPGDAQPFEYQSDSIESEAFDVAGTHRGDMYACDIISIECKGSVLREFPSQYLDSTYNDIQTDARDGVKDARKALKLLNDNRFKK